MLKILLQLHVIEESVWRHAMIDRLHAIIMAGIMIDA